MRYLIGLFLCLPLWLSALVVNTEKLRINREESGITGEVDLSLGLTRNKAGQTLRFGTGGRLEWLRGSSRWLLLGGYNRTPFTNVDEPGSAPKNFAHNAFGHLRFNRGLSPGITPPAFF